MSGQEKLNGNGGDPPSEEGPDPDIEEIEGPDITWVQEGEDSPRRTSKGQEGNQDSGAEQREG